MAYLAGVYGQGPVWGMAIGGFLTSNGVRRTVQRTKQNLGYDGDCYNFNQLAAINIELDTRARQYQQTAMLCYSLGVTTGTNPGRHKLDLLLCVAGSELGMNYNVNKLLTKRSVLIRGSGILSDWGKNAGFDTVHDLAHVPHLLMDFHPDVIKICENELAALIGRKS